MAMFGAFSTFGKLGSPAGSRSLLAQIQAMGASFIGIPSLSNYQDSAGTTLVTQPGGGAADPPVGLVLDLSGLGNHAIQSTSTARPKLSARVNLLTYSEDFSNAAWTYFLSTRNGLTTAPDGTSTAQLITLNSQYAYVAQNISLTMPSGTNQLWIKRISGNTGLYLRAATSALTYATPITITDEWVKYSAAWTSDGSPFSFALQDRNASGQGQIAIWHPQLETGSTATRYQRVTDANTYDYSGFPLIHQFDAVDDAHVITFGSSLGSDCTVVTANRGTTPTIQTGQTIGTSYTITTTHAGKLIFPRALTAAETAIVTAWATKQGAIA